MVVMPEGSEERREKREERGEKRDERKSEWVVHIQAGGGIVADSDPDAEHQETVNKAAALAKAVDLAEQAFRNGK
jgi:anthranilate synthase component 1